MEYLLVVAYTLLFVYLIKKIDFFKIEGFSKNAICLVFILKIISGIVVFLIYSYFYSERRTGDIFKYFDDGNILFSSIYTSPVNYFKMIFGINNNTPEIEYYFKTMNSWYRQFENQTYNDNHVLIRFNAIVRLFSFGYYNVHTVFMCFLSLTGLVALYKFFTPYFKENKTGLFISVFLLPSVLLWCSGVLKEGLLIFGLGLFLYYLQKIILNKFKLKYLLFVLLLTFLLFRLKSYVLLLMLPLLVCFFWVEKSRKNILFKYIFVVIIYFIILLNIGYLFKNYKFNEIIVQKQKDFIGLAKDSDAGSYININELKPNLLSFIKNSPEAFAITMFRPHIFESKNKMMLFAAIENLFLILLIIFSIIFVDKRRIKSNIFIFCITFTILTYILIGLVTPVLGAVVRYKVPVLPFLAISMFYVIDYNKLCIIYKKTTTKVEK